MNNYAFIVECMDDSGESTRGQPQVADLQRLQHEYCNCYIQENAGRPMRRFKDIINVEEYLKVNQFLTLYWRNVLVYIYPKDYI